MTTHPRPGTRAARGAERVELVRVAAETLAVGALFALFSLPVVTAGAAWCAAAETTAAWHTHREPPLLRTFTRVVGRDLAAGLAGQCAVLLVGAVAWFEIHVVVRSRLPGYPLEAAALGLLATAALAFVLLTVAHRAHDAAGGAAPRWQDAARATAALVRTAPSAPVLVAAGCAATVALVAVIPAFAAVMAGPLAYAVSAVLTRARRGTRDGREAGPGSRQE
ncbi:hypothetical protein [Streptomyces sp. NPDC050560]|uniref:hypothetical protein n=1 Tax=Streptomyces sp. NPDC050560 TaxID=3365630 RepID=UPI0037B785F5